MGQTLSEIGSQVTTIAMPLLVLALTGSAAKAGLVGVARMVASPLVSLPAERGLIGEAVSDALYSDARCRQRGSSRCGLRRWAVARGALFGLSRALLFVADTVSFLAAIVSLAIMRRPAPGVGSRPSAPGVGPGAAALGRGLRGAVGEAREGMSWLWRHPFLRAGALLYAVANVSLDALELLGLLIARHQRWVSTRFGVLAEIWFDAALTPGLFVAHSPITIRLLLA